MMKLNTFLTFVLSVSALVSCSDNGERTELFNGKDLEGWELYVDPQGGVQASDVFTVKDGNIHVAGLPFGYMRTTEKIADGTIHFEWRWVGEGTNSGFFIRLQDNDKLWPNAIECQLCNGKAGDFVMLGGSKIKEVECVAEFPVKDRAGDFERPVGEWNEAEIVCKGKEITVYVNGQLQNRCTADSIDGYIALQSEGGPLEFRNIYLTK